MEIIKVSAEEDEVVLASDVSAVELDEIREWLCYTKPIGHSMKVIARPAPLGDSVFRVRTTGTDPGPSDNDSPAACSFLRSA